MVSSNHLEPFDYILGFATVAAFVSVVDITEILRLIVLVITVIGATIKLIQQYFKSESELTKFYDKIKLLWKMIRRVK